MAHDPTDLRAADPEVLEHAVVEARELMLGAPQTPALGQAP
jgi:hypothetical protein